MKQEFEISAKKKPTRKNMYYTRLLLSLSRGNYRILRDRNYPPTILIAYLNLNDFEHELIF